jgi:hypothetical protein
VARRAGRHSPAEDTPWARHGNNGIVSSRRAYQSARRQSEVLWIHPDNAATSYASHLAVRAHPAGGRDSTPSCGADPGATGEPVGLARSTIGHLERGQRPARVGGSGATTSLARSRRQRWAPFSDSMAMPAARATAKRRLRRAKPPQWWLLTSRRDVSPAHSCVAAFCAAPEATRD